MLTVCLYFTQIMSALQCHSVYLFSIELKILAFQSRFEQTNIPGGKTFVDWERPLYSVRGKYVVKEWCLPKCFVFYYCPGVVVFEIAWQNNMYFLFFQRFYELKICLQNIGRLVLPFKMTYACSLFHACPTMPPTLLGMEDS